MEQGKIILLNGASSSGKTSLANALLGILAEPYQIVQLDSFLEIRIDKTGRVTENMVFQASKLLNQCVKALIEKGTNVIIDHRIIDEKIFRSFVSMFRDITVYMVYMFCPIEELRRREEARTNRIFGTIEEAVYKIYPEDIFDIYVDTFTNNVDECAEMVKAYLDKGQCTAIKRASFLMEIHLSNKEMCSKIEEGLEAYLQAVTAGGVRPFYKDEQLGWVKTFPTAWSNYIFYANFSEENMEEQVAEVIEGIKKGDLPAEWLVGPKSRPKNLTSCLEKNGFSVKYSMAGMAINLEEMDADIAIPQGMEIIEVVDPKTLSVWTDVISNGLWNGNPFESALFEPLLIDERFKFYLALLEGKPVSASMIELLGDYACVDMIATLEEHRGKGIGTAITKTPLVCAKCKGYKFAVLQASKSGEPVYRKIGFEEYCRFYDYQFIIQS